MGIFTPAMMQWREVIYIKSPDDVLLLEKNLSGGIKDSLDITKMRQTAEMFIGLKDFQSFTADDPEEKSTKVHINSIDVQAAGDIILIRIVGSHFIWKMVRQIIGVLAEVGRGKMPLNEVKKFLYAKSDEPAKLTAPPSGLFLERVYYKGDVWLKELKPMIEISTKLSMKFIKKNEEENTIEKTHDTKRSKRQDE